MFKTTHGKLATVILLRQKFVREYYEFCKMLWYEMRHACSIEYECPGDNFIRFNAPVLLERIGEQLLSMNTVKTSSIIQGIIK